MYEGPRTSWDIIAYVLKKIGPPSKQVDNVEELHSIISNVKLGPVAVYFGTTEDDPNFIEYQYVAKRFELISFYHTFSPEALEHLKLASDTKIAVFKDFDEKMNIYDNKSFDYTTLIRFFAISSVPNVLPFNQLAVEIIFKG